MNEKEHSNQKRIRVLIAKPGLDGHDRGAKVIVHALKDAGMDVLYTGLHNTIEDIVQMAEQGDVDVIGMSIYSGAHLALSEKLMKLSAEKGIAGKVVLVGGNIPFEDIEALKGYGIDGVFPTGANLDEIVRFIKERVKDKK